MIRAFKSTLEDLEEKRSEHSVHSFRNSRSHSGLRHSIPENILSHVEAGDSLGKSTSLHPHLSSAAMGLGDSKSSALHFADEHGRHHPQTGDPERDRQRQIAPNGHNNNNSHIGPVPYIPGSRYNGHSGNNYPHSYPYDARQSSVNSSQMVAPYQPVTPQLIDSNLPPPPSSVLTIRLDYDSLPDLPADLPRLVHETSI